jgi:hypothetical protein
MSTTQTNQRQTPGSPHFPTDGPSLLEGIDASGGKAEPVQRYEIGAARPVRQAIDANWTPKQRRIATVACGVLAVVTLSAGAWWTIANRPPGLPTTIDEALAVMNSRAFRGLDEDRQRQYAAEAARLLQGVSEEDRQRLFQDEKNRQAARRIREEQMEETARRVARGEKIERPMMPWGPGRGPGGGPGGGGPGGGGPGGAGGPGGPGGPGVPAGARPPGGGPGGPGGPGGGRGAGGGQMSEEMRQRIVNRVERGMQTGNAQNMGLRTEMMQRFQAQRSANPSGGQPRRGP